MSPTTVVCPECQARLKLAGTVAPGKKICCSRCQAVFAAAGPQEARPVPLPSAITSPRPAPPRGLVRDLADDDEEAGARPVRRPRSRHSHDEFDPDEPPARPWSRFRDEDNGDEDYRPRRRRLRKKQGNPALLWGLLGGGVLLVAGVAVLLIVLLTQGKEESPGKDGNKDLAGNRIPAGPKDGNKDLVKDGPNGWAPDPILVNQLGPEVTVQGYRVRPPQGYVMKQLVQMGGHVVTWTGGMRVDRTAPLLLMQVHPVPPAEARAVPLETQFKNYLAGYKANFKAGFRQGSGGKELLDFGESGIEHGQLSGVKFVRCRLTGTVPNRRKLHGFCYVALDGDKLIAFTFVDMEPHPCDSLGGGGNRRPDVQKTMTFPALTRNTRLP
jgi:hypothetical protein